MRGHSELMHLDDVIIVGGLAYFFFTGDVLGLVGVAVGVGLHFTMSGSI